MNRYSLLLITSMLLVGSNVGIGKSIVEFVPVPLFALLRFVIPMAVLWPLLRASKLRRVKRDEWFNLFLQALFGTFGLTLLMLGGVQRASAVAAGVITSTIPAVVALLSWLILKERPNGRALASIALASLKVKRCRQWRRERRSLNASYSPRGAWPDAPPVMRHHPARRNAANSPDAVQ